MTCKWFKNNTYFSSVCLSVCMCVCLPVWQRAFSSFESFIWWKEIYVVTKILYKLNSKWIIYCFICYTMSCKKIKLFSFSTNRLKINFLFIFVKAFSFLWRSHVLQITDSRRNFTLTIGLELKVSFWPDLVHLFKRYSLFLSLSLLYFCLCWRISLAFGHFPICCICIICFWIVCWL